MAKQVSALSQAASVLARANAPKADKPATPAKNKPAPKVTKAATETKPAQATPAPVVNAHPFAPAKAQVSPGLKISHAIRDTYRPGAGSALFAHTAVFLTYSGIADAPVPSAVAETIIGARAIKWHTDSGNFEKVGDQRDASGKVVRRGGLTLTPKGRDAFAKRIAGLDPEAFSAFENVLCRGELDERAMKNPAGLLKIAE